MARTGEKIKSIDTTFEIVNHLAHADAANDLKKSDFSTFADLAKYDTVSVKISKIVHASDEGFPYEDTYDRVRWLLDNFGRERVVWGSDFPNVSHPEFGGMTYEETRSWLDHGPFPLRCRPAISNRRRVPPVSGENVE